MIFDKTCRGNSAPIGLSHSWIAGGLLFATLNRLDAYKGVSSWQEALEWLGEINTNTCDMIDEIQFWGHGTWGTMLIDGEVFDIDTLDSEHAFANLINTVRDRLHAGSQIWIRTCQTLGALSGQRFAEAMTDRFGCTVAGHTYIIGPIQSGLQIIHPGESANWDPRQGIREGTPRAPIKARWSKLTSPRTVSFLNINIPKRFYRELPK